MTFNISDWAKGRYAIYTYLADCYLDIPTEKTAGAGREFAEIFARIAENTGKNMQQGSGLLAAFADEFEKSKAESSLQKLLERLNMEYTALFMTGEAQIPFYESAVLGENAPHAVEIQLNMHYFFAWRQLERRGPLNIPEDAICHELDYMARASALMAETEDSEALNSILAEQCAFLEDHLLKWIEVFSSKARERAEQEKSLFYTAIATLTKEFVLFDYKILISLMDEIH